MPRRTERMIADLGLREAATAQRVPAMAQAGARAGAQPDAGRKAWLQEVAPGVDSSTPTRRRGTYVAADGRCRAGLLRRGRPRNEPGVRWVQTYNAGVERCLTSDVFRQRGIVLTNMQRIAGPVMAEHVMALVLAHSRGLPGTWSRSAKDDGPAERVRRTGRRSMRCRMAISPPSAGRQDHADRRYGGVGSEVAKRAQAFGIRIIAIRNSKADLPPASARWACRPICPPSSRRPTSS